MRGAVARFPDRDSVGRIIVDDETIDAAKSLGRTDIRCSKFGYGGRQGPGKPAKGNNQGEGRLCSIA
jgi:hypothetical protein